MQTHLKLTPLGGVGEIGSNMFLFEDDQSGFIIDCGILFPSDNCFNINYLIPNFYGLKKEKIKDIIITHGHEDHIGAIAHLIEFHPDITVHCNGFAFELIKTKVKEFNYKVFKYNDTIKIGDFSIDPIHVNHSIPDTFGLSISYNEYNFFYCSDFKVDFDSPYEKPFDFEKLRRLQQNKTTVGMIDSTNILSPRKTLSEKVVLEEMENVFKDFKDNRLLITCFSSNVHRLKSFFDLARKYNRNIILSGRSIHKYTQIAKKLDYIERIRIYDEDYENISKKNNVIIVSGCQGDFFSSLRRLSSNEHSRIKLTENDKVIFSSKTIPGNEKSVNRIQNNITELGAEVITSSDYPNIHASGHPGQEDLIILNKELEFNHYIPIHGESYFIKKHIDFIKKLKPNVRTHLLRNFDILKINKSNFRVIEKEAVEPIIIQGENTKVERSKISDRRKIAFDGLVIVNTKNLDDIRLVGLPGSADELIPLVKKEIGKTRDNEKLRVNLRRFFKTQIGLRPIVHVL